MGFGGGLSTVGGYIFGEDGVVCCVDLLDVGWVEEIVKEMVLHGPEVVEFEVWRCGCSGPEHCWEACYENQGIIHVCWSG